MGATFAEERILDRRRMLGATLAATYGGTWPCRLLAAPVPKDEERSLLVIERTPAQKDGAADTHRLLRYRFRHGASEPVEAMTADAGVLGGRDWMVVCGQYLVRDSGGVFDLERSEILSRATPDIDGPRTYLIEVRQLEPPGFLALHYGVRTPISVLFAHVAFRAILDGFYSPH